MYKLWPPLCLAVCLPNSFSLHNRSYTVHSEDVRVLVCTVYMCRGRLTQPDALCIDISIQPYGQKKNVERHSLTLWTVASFKIHSCHMGEAQGPGLMQRKAAPSWPGVKTLIDTHMHLFSRATAGRRDDAAACFSIYILPHAVVSAPRRVRCP